MYKTILLSFTVLVISLISSEAFAPSSVGPSMLTSTSTSTSALQMGFFDDVKFLFSDEAKEAARKRKEEEAEEQLRLQQEIYERRNNPEKMEEYEKAKVERRMMYKNQKLDYQIREEKYGEDGTWTEEK